MKEFIINLNYKFPVSKKKVKLKWKTTFASLFSVMKINRLFLFMYQINEYISRNKKNKNKKYFCKSCLQCFGNKNALTEHKDVCLNINVSQSLKLEKRTIQFKNYFKQIPAPFKILADFECCLKSNEGSC